MTFRLNGKYLSVYGIKHIQPAKIRTFSWHSETDGSISFYVSDQMTMYSILTTLGVIETESYLDENGNIKNP